MPQSKKQLVIGTANFGTPYGVRQTEVASSEIEKIVSDAVFRKDVFLETGPSYIGVERKIGLILKGKDYKRIILKVPPTAYDTVENFLNSVNESLIRLNQASVYAILLHGTKDAFQKYSRVIEQATKELLDSKVAQRVGIACYEEIEVLTAISIFPHMSIFQLPENIVDRRKINSSELRRLNEGGVVFQVRSVFLQGLLLDAPKVLPAELMDIYQLRIEIENSARAVGLSSRELCIQYAAGISWASQVVIGAENFQQYLQNFESLSAKREEVTFQVSKASDFITDPRKWN